jgi:hypothetical protein
MEDEWSIDSVPVEAKILMCEIGLTPSDGLTRVRIRTSCPDFFPGLDTSIKILYQVSFGGIGKLALSLNVVVS